MIIPSIDLMNGKAVQLKQGKEKVLERENVLELAKEFSKYGEVAVIDLDAAFGKGDNLSLIKKICKIADCRVGGGIRTLEKAEEILKAGAKKLIIGTKANKEFLSKLPSDRIIVAVDSRNGFVVDNGWIRNTKRRPQDIIDELENYCSGFLFTNVDKEGMMQGIELIELTSKNKITVAGGITSIKDIQKLESKGFDSQIGMAIYTGKIKLDDAFISLLDFDKGLIPTVVQDLQGQVLMVGFSSQESLKKAFEIKRGVYFSRSRNELWEKGKTSGNYQELIDVKYDCDKDSLLFIVKQKNFACCKGSYSCFGEKKFGFQDLYETILDRMNNPNPKSYTSKLMLSEDLIKKKIKEECGEVLNYEDRENLIWEIADLTYFVMALMIKKGICLDEIKNELWRRRK